MENSILELNPTQIWNLIRNFKYGGLHHFSTPTALHYHGAGKILHARKVSAFLRTFASKEEALEYLKAVHAEKTA